MTHQRITPPSRGARRGLVGRLVVALGVLGSLAFVPASPAGPAPAAGTGTEQTYIVLYSQLAVSSDAAARIQAAGGTLVASYGQIGVAVARSSNDAFAAALKADSRIEGVSATNAFGVQLPNSSDGESMQVVDAATMTGQSSWGDSMSARQWDMVQIHVPEAYAVQPGSPAVVVGDIDTGLDYTHPDLAANVDFARSVSCVSGAPDTVPAAWMDDNGHGTHTAGTIAAAKNGFGIVGVAPGVKIAGIKAGNADGYFFPEAVVCAFVWAAEHGINVTNNSYFADPWLFNCKNDPEQRAIWEAERRAIRYAISNGVVVVAAAGNENMDLSKTNIDTISPDNATPLTREVTNACAVVPVEVPGVVGVSGDGYLEQKAYFSSYGVGVISVVAPSGDRRFQVDPFGARGYVLSTFPGNRYALAQGTSMASPHVAGVAALIESQYPGIRPGAVTAMLQSTADPMVCPPNPFNPGGAGDWLATCTGGSGYNGFYGNGQVNALSAVTHQP